MYYSSFLYNESYKTKRTDQFVEKQLIKAIPDNLDELLRVVGDDKFPDLSERY